jgi:hypothetical protein
MQKNISHSTKLAQLLSAWKSNGALSIPISVIEDAMAQDFATTDLANAEYEHQMEVWRINSPIEAQRNIEMFKATLETGQTAIKSLTIINGGAAIALLAFVGNALNKDKPIDISGFHCPLTIFVAGVGLAALASASRYFSQDAYNYKSRLGTTFKVIAILAGLFSLVAFAYGAIETSSAFQSIQAN